MGAGGPSSGTGNSKSVTTQKAQKDLQVSAYEREIEKQKAEAKAKSKVTEGTLSDPREKDDTAAKMSLFREQGVTNLKNQKFQTPTTALLSGVFAGGSRVNRDFFTDKVLGSKNYKGTTKQDFERMSRSAQESMYKDYFTARSSGKIDAYGNTLSQGDNGGAIGSSGQVVQAPTVTAPTTAEVSQSAATDVAEDNILLRKRKAKARGRSPTIMTGVTGATGSLTLGKPSLLGR
jgi:hypothetical protein